MEAIQFNQLEQQIERLIAELNHLRIENEQLHQQLNSNNKRYEALNTKNTLAAEKIKKVVNQLRESML